MSIHKQIREKVTSPEVRRKTEHVLERVNHLARESHVHHVTIKDRHHRPFLAFPMSLGIAFAVILPVLAGIGLAAFLINDWLVEVERHSTPETE